MGNRLSGRLRQKKTTSGDVSTSSTRTGKSPPSSGSVTVRLRAAASRVGYRRGGGGGRSREQVVSCPDLGDDERSGADGQHLTADSGVLPDLTVYRSYGGGFGELTTPDDDDEVTHGGGRITVVADSVPDIKIYRRSAMMFNGDDDDNALYHSNHRYMHVRNSVVQSAAKNESLDPLSHLCDSSRVSLRFNNRREPHETGYLRRRP